MKELLNQESRKAGKDENCQTGQKHESSNAANREVIKNKERPKTNSRTSKRAAETTSLVSWLVFCVPAFLILLICAVSVNGQGYTVHDGNWWVQQSASIKVGYVIGCMDHVSTANPDWSASVRFEQPPKINDVCDRLDAFYGARMNRDVTLQQAIPWALMEISRGR